MTRIELFEAFANLSSHQKDLAMIDIFAKFQVVEDGGSPFKAEQFFGILEEAVAPAKSEYIEDDVHFIFEEEAV